jgi:Ser/Thr protein kinase RdoA (MazF antagonist)
VQPFETLDYAEQLARLAEAAGVALRSYGYNHVTPRPVMYVNNAVFEVHTADGGHFALRLHRPGHKRLEWIKSELAWLTAICRDTTLGVPQPIHAIDAEPIVYTPVRGLSEPLVCTLFVWIEGRFEETDKISLQMARDAGEFLARLHNYAASFEPPSAFARPRLDEDGLFGAESAYDPGEGVSLFTDEHLTTFAQVENQVRGVMSALGKSHESFGLIHADFIMKNIVYRGAEVCAIDFDDCGWGYYLYDLAPLLLQFKDEPHYLELSDAFLEGYNENHPLPEMYQGYIETFIAARHLLSCWWVAGNLRNPRIRERAPEIIAHRTAELRRFLETGSISQQGEAF